MFTKFASLALLYFVQGLPYGFQDKALPIFLRDRGASYSQLTLSRVLLIPWLCKAAFAPLMDSFMTKSAWLRIILLGMSVTCMVGVCISESLINLLVLLFSLNVLSSIQDVAADSIALEILKNDDLAYGNTVQVVSYKVGALFGGGVLFFVYLKFGWIGLFTALTMTYLLTTGVASVVLPPRSTSVRISQSHTPWKNVASVQGTYSVAAFLMFYKLGESGALSIFPIVIIDNGFSKETLGFWNGIVGQGLSLLGSLYAGHLITDSRSTVRVLYRFSLVRTGPVIFQWLIVCNSTGLSTTYGNTVISLASLFILQFTSGIITTAAFTTMMECSQKAPCRLQTTHYTLLASIEVASKLLFSALTGSAVDLIGLQWVYVALVAVTALVPFTIPNLR